MKKSVHELFSFFIKNMIGLYHRFVNSLKQVIISILSLFVLFFGIVTGVNYMNASELDTEVSDVFLDNVIDYNKKLVISNEVTIVEKEKKTFSGSIPEGIYIDYIKIGNGTLIMGKAQGNSQLLLTSRSGVFCEANTSSSGKFGCMFSGESLSSEDVIVLYK